MAAKSATGRILNASISKIVQNVLIYMCANFGAFRTIWTIGFVFFTMPLDYVYLYEYLVRRI